jgi:HEPN domain-containing protein
LKAFLIFHGKPVPKIHDLEELQRQCILIEPFAELQQLDFSQITDFAVEIRYDIEFWPNL